MAKRSVIFDLDDTLIVEEAVARSSLREAAGLCSGRTPDQVEEAVLSTARRLWRAGPHHRVCLDLGIASWEGLWATFEGGHASLDGLREWAPSYREETWRSALRELEIDDPELASAMSGAYQSNQRRGHPLIPGSAELVRSLTDGRRLGLLTNGPADIQRLKLEQTGLERCFDAVVISGEAGMGKPSPAVFEHALDQLGIDASEAIMVGDNWERDVLGALAVGMTAVWVSGGRRQPETRASVTPIRRVGEMAGIATQLGL